MAKSVAEGKKDAVIRKIESAAETSHQRLMRKHVPAWVVSGALHVALVAALLVIDRFMPKTATAMSEAQLTVVNDEKAEEASKEDLTNPDIGLDPELKAAVEADRLDDVNVETKVVSNDPPGLENAQSNLKTDFIPPPGIGNPDINAGTTGDAGDFAMGSGGGTGVMNNPGFLGRGAATKSKLLAKGGGNSRSEAAVARGLIWLAKQQKPNGSWVYDGSSKSDTAAATGMALLPFLAAGQTHKVSKDNKYKNNVEGAVKYLISQQKPNGSFTSSMYSHAIATVAICELLGMSGDRSLLQVPAQKAINFIQQAQGTDGSWGYGANSNGDTSIVGWQIQALHSAKLCKELVVNKATIDRANKFLDSVASGSNKSQYGYRTPGGTPTLTAVGLLCRYYENGWGPNNPGFAAGVGYLMKSKLPRPGQMDMYYYYYATQVMHFFEGPEWHRDWNPKMRDMLIDLQTPEGKREAGSWDPDGDNWIGGHCGRVGMTSMCLLTLEVYYRHLPLYKRDAGGLKELERVK